MLQLENWRGLAQHLTSHSYLRVLPQTAATRRSVEGYHLENCYLEGEDSQTAMLLVAAVLSTGSGYQSDLERAPGDP